MTFSQAKREFIKIRGINVYCEYILNEYPPIFLIHGFVSSTYTFHRLIPLLGKHFSVIAIDLPGFGRSEKSKKFVYSFHQYADVLIGCINHFKLKNVILMGHSMGGQIALYTARKIPDNISKLILLCSSGYLKRSNPLLISFSYLPLFHSFIQYYIKRKGVKENLKNVFYDEKFITDDLIEEFGKPLKEKNFYHALKRLIRHREGDLTEEQLKEIKVPTLLIWGEDDKVVPVSVGKRLVKDLTDADLITFNQTGHLVTVERTIEVYNQVLSYIFGKQLGT